MPETTPETPSPVTAAQIAEDCPHKLVDLGQRITAHLEKAAKLDQKAEDHRISAGQLLAEAKQVCDEGGFTAFRERFCPELGKSRVYELLAIATGKKTEDEIRADNAERNRRHRSAKKDAAVRHVTESAPKAATTVLQIARAEAQKAKAEAVARMFPPTTKGIPSASREPLIEALSKLASGNLRERAEAATAVERQRACLGMTWDQLIVPADEAAEVAQREAA